MKKKQEIVKWLKENYNFKKRKNQPLYDSDIVSYNFGMQFVSTFAFLNDTQLMWFITFIPTDPPKQYYAEHVEKIEELFENTNKSIKYKWYISKENSKILITLTCYVNYKDNELQEIFQNLQDFMNYLRNDTNEIVDKLLLLNQKYSGDFNPYINLIHKITTLQENLKKKLFGQDEVIDSVCDAITEMDYKITKNTPKGVFFFLGQPATGKTMLAKLLSKFLEGYSAFKTIDMTQYSSENQGFGLFGGEKGYKDSTHGELTSFVKENPRSIILFDEIEKAHSGVLSNFLTLLSSGEAVDKYSRETIDFRKTILVFTSNLGSELYNNYEFMQELKQNKPKAQQLILDTIAREEKLQNGHYIKTISPEMLSRLSSAYVILFNKLTYKSIYKIAYQEIDTIYADFFKRYKVKLNMNGTKFEVEALISLLILSFAPNIDVRKVKSHIPKKLFDTITDYAISSKKEINHVELKIDKDAYKFVDEMLLQKSEEQQNQFIQSLFRKNYAITYKTSLEYENKELKITFHSVEQTKLSRSSDFQGEGGLVFEVPDISFKDIAGHTDAKSRLHEIVNLLKKPEDLTKYGIDMPKGMLLHGVPGTGKTMLAKAFANEADLPFIETTGSELLNLSLMKQIFKKAKEYAPSIIFIDEIDAIGTRNGSHYDAIINQFLTEINGFSDSFEDMVFIVAATNFKNKIDPAILRSGRIDLHVKIDRLDKEARQYFLNKIYETPIEGEFDKESILTYTSGMTGADLEKVVRESFLYLYRNSLKALSQEILVEQINTIKYGKRITNGSIKEIIESTALHEAGHAVVSKVLQPNLKIEQITVIPRGNAFGFVSYDTEPTFANLTITDIKNKMSIAYAGREAQIKMYGKDMGIDSGASSDLNLATQYAYTAIAELGMGEKIKSVNITNLKNEQLFQDEIEQEMKEWITEARMIAKDTVAKYWNEITKLAKLLMEKEIVGADELEAILT